MFSSFRGDPELIKLVRTMKLIIVFLMVSVSALFANVAAQDMKLDLRVEHKSLIEVMDLLKQKSGFSFIYSAAEVESVTGITMDVRDKTIREVLDIALSGTELTYTIEGCCPTTATTKKSSYGVCDRAECKRYVTGSDGNCKGNVERGDDRYSR